ncbi:MAG: hypothetical protein ACE5K9_04425 [Candidatus Methylomirabilales bacterium]
MVTWSVIAAVLGVGGAAALVARNSHRWSHWGPERFWLLGMGALAPAWLIAFLSLLAPANGLVPKGVLIGSSAVPLLGAIVTDTLVRRLRVSGRDHRPMTYWLLGVAGMLPGWSVALFILIGST